MVNNPFSTSALFNENSFYKQFIHDLKHCKKEVIIESPFITTKRMNTLYPIFEKLINKNIKIYIFTRNPVTHVDKMKIQAEQEIQRFESLGIQTFICSGNHHRKLAILDKKILWEGSLNILSQTKSREIMRRIDNDKLSTQMFDFIDYKSVIN